MTEKDLKILYTGSYQYKQAILYLAEMMDESGKINLQFVTEESNQYIESSSPATSHEQESVQMFRRIYTTQHWIQPGDKILL